MPKALASDCPQSTIRQFFPGWPSTLLGLLPRPDQSKLLVLRGVTAGLPFLPPALSSLKGYLTYSGTSNYHLRANNFQIYIFSQLAVIAGFPVPTERETPRIWVSKRETKFSTQKKPKDYLTSPSPLPYLLRAACLADAASNPACASSPLPLPELLREFFKIGIPVFMFISPLKYLIYLTIEFFF